MTTPSQNSQMPTSGDHHGPARKNRVRVAAGAVAAAAMVAAVGVGVAGADGGSQATDPDATLTATAVLASDTAVADAGDPVTAADDEVLEDEMSETESLDDEMEHDEGYEDDDEMDEVEDPAVEAYEYLPAEEKAAAFAALTADQQALVIDDETEDAAELIEELDEAGVAYTLETDPITGVEHPVFDETDPAAAEIVADELDDEMDDEDEMEDTDA